MKVVAAADSFKGSLKSSEVNAAIKAGVLSAVPDARIVCLTVGDGGEGTARAMTTALDGLWVNCTANDPLMRPIMAGYGMVNLKGVQTALIDIASASGLTLLAEAERSAMLTTTYGTGQLIADAVKRGAQHVILGLGGSATCDGGAGLLAALGAQFYDIDNHGITPNGATLGRIESINIEGINNDIKQCRYTLMCDVNNPLYGPKGSAHMFAQQKKASADEIEELDRGLKQLATVIKRHTGQDVSYLPGAGAAGGAGASVVALLGGKLCSGVETMLDIVGIDKAFRDADLVITGEGCIDRQTLHGKLPMGVCRRATHHRVPTVAIAGMVKDISDLLAGGFADIRCINSPGMPLDTAMQPDTARANIKATVRDLVSLRQAAKNAGR